MAFQIISYIVDPGDGKIKVSHTFYGHTRAEAEEYREHHIASCEYFSAAVEEGREMQEIEEVDDDELPVAEAEK